MSLKKKFFQFLLDLSKKFSRKGIYPFLLSELKQFPSGTMVLNIGAGGEIGKQISELCTTRDIKLTTFDIDPARHPDIVGDIHTYNFEEATYNVVILCEVLEHLHSPQLALANVFKVLKSDGQLMISVPFIFPIHDCPRDYYRYTKYGLTFLLRDYKSLVISERNSGLEAIIVLCLRYLYEAGFCCRIFGFFSLCFAVLCSPLILLLSSCLRTDFATTGYLVVAKK